VHLGPAPLFAVRHPEEGASVRCAAAFVSLFDENIFKAVKDIHLVEGPDLLNDLEQVQGLLPEGVLEPSSHVLEKQSSTAWQLGDRHHFLVQNEL